MKNPFFFLLLLLFVFSYSEFYWAKPVPPELPDIGVSAMKLPILVDSQNLKLKVPEDFNIELFIDGLLAPRWIIAMPNDEILVSQSRTETFSGMPKEAVDSLTRLGIFGPSPNNVIKITVNDNKKSAKTFIDNLNQPFGMIYFQEQLFVANTDSIMRFDYQKETLNSLGKKIIDLPFSPSNNHWTRNIILNAEKDKILVSVGSGTNVNEEGTDTKDRAAIWEINFDGTDKRLYATGLRNPVGMSYDPSSGKLWTTVNERDGLGENVPPDYLTEVVDGEFYGWPFVYFGIYPDPIQLKINPKKVADAQLNARVPDMALGAHTVPLGLLFHSGKNIDQKYKNGAFVARRGGVSRSILSGYDVVFIPFKDGYPTGEIETFISGFIADQYRGEIYGRPVGLAEMNDGTILLSDDASGKIWKISYKKN